MNSKVNKHKLRSKSKSKSKSKPKSKSKSKSKSKVARSAPMGLQLNVAFIKYIKAKDPKISHKTAMKLASYYKKLSKSSDIATQYKEGQKMFDNESKSKLQELISKFDNEPNKPRKTKKKVKSE